MFHGIDIHKREISQLEFHIHHAKEAAKIVKILSLLDPKTGTVMKNSPRCLLAKQNAMVEVGAKFCGPVRVSPFVFLFFNLLYSLFALSRLILLSSLQVALQDPVCVEEYSSCRALGRVFLRASGRTIALGVVTQIIKRDK